MICAKLPTSIPITLKVFTLFLSNLNLYPFSVLIALYLLNNWVLGISPRFPLRVKYTFASVDALL